MSDSVRETVLKNLKTTLEGIQRSVGYDLDIIAVYRIPRVIEPSFPCIMIMDVAEDKEDVPTHKTTSHLQIQVQCWMMEYEDLSVASSMAIANIEKALYVDRSRGGNAIDTNVLGNFLIIPQEGVPYGGVTLNVDVIYRHKLYDPFTK